MTYKENMPLNTPGFVLVTPTEKVKSPEVLNFRAFPIYSSHTK